MKINKKYWFTLVEVIVSVAIFWIIITSIIWIYITSWDILVKADINRKMQENLKNVSSTIAEDIRKNWILWVSNWLVDPCDFNITWNKYKTWNKLCTKSGNDYYLAKKDILTWLYTRVGNSSCWDIKDKCVIYKLGKWKLTNSFVSVKSLDFYLSKDNIPKLTMIIVMQPSIQKWVKIDLIKNSKLNFQTTISERPF